MDNLRAAFSSFLLSTGLDLPTFIITFITTITFIGLLTRLTSGDSTGKVLGTGESPRPPQLPYWIPFLGHLVPFIYDQESVLKDARYSGPLRKTDPQLIELRSSAPAGIFALKLGRERHNFIYSAPLIKKFLSQDKSSISEKPFRLKIMTNAFGLPAKQASLYQAIISQLDAAILPHLRLSDVSKETLTETLRHLQGNLPDLVTFNPSMVDQEPWVCRSFKRGTTLLLPTTSGHKSS
jgi:hypothetical protein